VRSTVCLIQELEAWSDKAIKGTTQSAAVRARPPRRIKPIHNTKNGILNGPSFDTNGINQSKNGFTVPRLMAVNRARSRAAS
jgi:hypothetical protein